MDDRRLVQYTVAAGLATITLDSVANRNALSAPLVEQLLAALSASASDKGVHAVVIAAEGPVFCSGADLTDPPSNEAGSKFSYPDVLEAILSCPKPVVARVSGHARAGGLGIIAACDIAIGSTEATFAFSEVRIGVAPAIISIVCERVMSPRALARYALTGASFDGAAAADAGLLTIAVEPHQLDPTVTSLMAEIRRTEPNAVARTKELLGELPRLSRSDAFVRAAQASAELFGSAEAREGIAAFREKRAASWAW